jgi:arylsulfatase A-like enzyme
VLTSDHGEEFGEGGEFEHGSSLLPWQTHVPLVVRPAGGAAATRVPTPVSVRDLPATLLEMVGAEAGELPGTPLLDGAGVPAASVGPVLLELRVDPATGERMWGLRDGEHLYVAAPGGVETLYDVAADPDAPRELTADGAEPAALSAMRARLREVVGDGG